MTQDATDTPHRRVRPPHLSSTAGVVAGVAALTAAGVGTSSFLPRQLRGDGSGAATTRKPLPPACRRAATARRTTRSACCRRCCRSTPRTSARAARPAPTPSGSRASGTPPASLPRSSRPRSPTTSTSSPGSRARPSTPSRCCCSATPTSCRSRRENWSVDPFAGTVKKGEIYGRGALDMKGANAASISALLRHVARGRDVRARHHRPHRLRRGGRGATARAGSRRTTGTSSTPAWCSTEGGWFLAQSDGTTPMLITRHPPGQGLLQPRPLRRRHRDALVQADPGLGDRQPVARRRRDRRLPGPGRTSPR